MSVAEVGHALAQLVKVCIQLRLRGIRFDFLSLLIEHVLEVLAELVHLTRPLVELVDLVNVTEQLICTARVVIVAIVAILGYFVDASDTVWFLRAPSLAKEFLRLDHD